MVQELCLARVRKSHFLQTLRVLRNSSRITAPPGLRRNLTMRMAMRWFTRLTNGFSKKVANHKHAVALHFMHYNFYRVHLTLHVTPAMEAG